jgi:ATP-dependent DNA ligase
MLLQAVAVINDRPQSLTISWAQMDDNASAHPADSHGAARNPNPDSFVPINPLDGELCAVRPDGTTSFAAMQAATDSGRSGELMFFLFDLLQLDGADMRPQPLLERKARLEWLLQGVDDRLV